MASETFHNLNPDKKEKIAQVLKKVFQEKPFPKVTVSEIVEELGIARGSFYQYFADLEDAYFEMLNREVVDIHALFMTILQSREGDLESALLEYGRQLAEILFAENSYRIYRNRYLYWNESLSRRWEEVHADHTRLFSDRQLAQSLEVEKTHYLKGVIHMLIQRNFKENWSKEEFAAIYRKHVRWMMEGVH